MPSSTQLVVIGAGPGGYAAAFYAADRGMQVALVDPEPNPGGVCLYRGCIPSKALLHVAGVLNEVKHAEAWGISFRGRTIDVKSVRAFKDKVVAQLTGGVGQVARMRKVNHIRGLAEFQDPRTLKITHDGKEADTLTFEHAIIATGSRPASVPGLSIESDRVMDSTAALDLPEIPASLLVVGGGYIGLELGTVYAALGSKVTVVEMTDGLLPGADRDLVNILARRIESMCEGVLLNTKVVSMKAVDKGVTVTFEGRIPEGLAKERTFDRVLIACYDAERGDYFRRHRDNSTPTTESRRFALTINLNSDEYEGGELIFPEYGDYRYKPPTGAAVLFSCSLLHEALPVTRGQRFALLSFLRDPDAKD